VCDRRFITVCLSETGYQLISSIFPGHVAHVVEAIGALTPTEQQQLAQLCRKLGLAQN